MRSRVAIAGCFSVLVAVLGWSSAGGAPADDGKKEPPPPKIVTLFYGIGDLLAGDSDRREVPNFRDDLSRPSDNWSADGSGNGPVSQQSPKTQEDTADEIIKLIQESIGPDTWRETGGALGSIRYARQQLIVSHTEEFHRQIKEFLGEYRKAAARTMRVRAHWVLADRTELDKVLKPIGDDGTPAAKPTTTPASVGSHAARLAVDPADLEKLRGPHLRGELLCTSGRRVFITAAQFHSVLVDAEPSVGQNVAAFAPTVLQLANGLVLDFQAAMVDDGRSVMATVRSQWKDLRVDPATMPVPLGPVAHATTRRVVAEPQQPILLDRTTGRIFDLKTTVRLPTGRMVMIGGMTLDPVAALKTVPQGKAGDGAATAPQLYLFIEVSAD
jgi:hypothetical protein